MPHRQHQHPCPAPHSTSAAGLPRPIVPHGQRSLAAMLVGAALTAVAAFMLLLSAVAAGPQLQSEPDRAGHQLFLPLVAANTSLTDHAESGVLDAGITVEARVSQACKPAEAEPVIGARITVVTDAFSATTTTDALGNAVFGATGEPARILIEWPTGLVPCPNSQPVMELPAGAGAVEFVARTYP